MNSSAQRKRLRVGVIFGGRSAEHEVSLVSAGSVLAGLEGLRYDAVPIGIAPDGRWYSSPDILQLLREKREPDTQTACSFVPRPVQWALVTPTNPEGEPLDVLFPVVHGHHGEDGSLQGLLELAGIPYVGAGVLASAVGMDKIVQKQLYREAGLPIAEYIWFYASELGRNSARVERMLMRKLAFPLFVKPANTGSSIGISKVHHAQELRAALVLAGQYDRKVIVERGIRDAREIEVSVLGNDEADASVPGEIIPSNEFYDYDAKYVDGASQAIVPARLPASIKRRVRTLALAAFKVMDCAGMARVDFFVSRRTKRVYLNEVNTIPGFTSISMYPKLWESSGLPFPALLEKLIQLALRRHDQKAALRTLFQPRTDWYT